jgi:4a-hydroxytetrahydrobiopterin dehydratase
MGQERLTEEEIGPELIGDGWSLAENALHKEYEFSSFPEAVKFVIAIADLAESVQHHPDIDIRFTKVILTLMSHEAKGVTSKDIDLAKAIDRLAAE